MKKTIMFLFFSLLVLLIGCNQDEITSSSAESNKGGISLSIDKTNAPSDVIVVIAYLSRNNYKSYSGYLNLLSESSADISFESIPAGMWHLKVDALNNDSLVIYRGENDIQVQENSLTQVILTLLPTGNGNGSLYS